MINPGERIDDLQCKGYQIIQNKDMFCFGMDAVLLANYVRFKRGGNYLDLGSGTGIIPILLAAKEYGDEGLTLKERKELQMAMSTDRATEQDKQAAEPMAGQATTQAAEPMAGQATAQAAEPMAGQATTQAAEPVVRQAATQATEPVAGQASQGVRFVGLELQTACAHMANRSVKLNAMENLVRIDEGDIKEVSCMYKKASFDIVTSNPPYIKGNHGLQNPEAPKNIARHEIHVTLEQVLDAAEYALKPGGSFYMVHKPFRLVEIFEELRKRRLEPKRMQLVHPYIDKEPNMVLIEAVKGGNSMIKIDPPMVVYEAPGVYTRQLLATYEGEGKCGSVD
jgi:tRNA1(Val) A37 N6-methylase TrmN6